MYDSSSLPRSAVANRPYLQSLSATSSPTAQRYTGAANPPNLHLSAKYAGVSDFYSSEIPPARSSYRERGRSLTRSGRGSPMNVPAANRNPYATMDRYSSSFGNQRTAFSTSIEDPYYYANGSRSAFDKPSLIRQHRSLDHGFQILSDPNAHNVGSFPSAPNADFHTANSQGYPGFTSAATVMSTAPYYQRSSTDEYGGATNPYDIPVTMSQSQSMNASAAAFGDLAASAVIPPSYAPVKDAYTMSMPVLQREYETLKREYEGAVQKLYTTMNSIKTFWSPELKKERTIRREETQRLALLNEQLRISAQENQRQSSVVRQIQDELQCQYELHRTIRDTDVQMVPRDEYDAIRHERDRNVRELDLLRNTVKELEVQIDTQRQTLNSRDDSIRKLLDMLQNKGIMPYNAAQDRMELEQMRSRGIELENRCRQLDSLCKQKELDIKALQEECMTASDKLRQMQMQYDRIQSIPRDERDPGAFQALLDSKDARIDELQRNVAVCEAEISHLRQSGAFTRARDFTDKSINSQDFSDLKTKLERSEIEYQQKIQQCQAIQARLAASEDQSADLRKHLEVLKETHSNKDQQISLLQSDIEALRQKLEARNDSIEQKTTEIRQVYQDRQKLQSEINTIQEQMKVKESKLNLQQRKIESLEDLLKDNQQQLEHMRIRVQSSPGVVQQQQWQETIDQMSREHERIVNELRQDRDKLEQERLEQMETHGRELKNLRQTIDMLQKELSDKEVLVESQSSKIEELDHELQHLRGERDQVLARMSYKATDSHEREMNQLRDDLHQARMECERLLKMVQDYDQEKKKQSGRIKDLEEQLRSAQGTLGSLRIDQRRTFDDKLNKDDLQALLTQKEQRIEELEEALRESVTITAEREVAVAQHKQAVQQTEAKANQFRDEVNRLRSQVQELQAQVQVLRNTQQDKDQLIRSLRHERKKHLEEVLELKQEALVAAISEKDAHIALLEMSQKPNSPDEIETLRRHKEKLMKKLKEENAKRMKLMNEQKEAPDLSTPLAKDLKSSPADQVIQAIRFVELQKKKMRVFIDQLVACVLEIDAEMLSGLPRTQQGTGIDHKLLRKLTHEQLLLELQQKENDSLQLQHYANQLLQRLARLQPDIVMRALHLLDSFATIQHIKFDEEWRQLRQTNAIPSPIV